MQQWCAPPAPETRRGQGQHERRTREAEVRQRVGDFARAQRAAGQTRAEVAAQLQVPLRTLRLWETLAARAAREPVLRGRPLACSPVAVRNEVIAWLDEAGPGVSLATLRGAFPALTRAELDDLLRRYRVLWGKHHTHAPYVLQWPVAGVVWALDFAHAPTPIAGQYPYLLAARDLGSGQQLLWLPVADMSAEVTLGALASLVAVHGAPLVLKSDNGAAFVAEATQGWARANGAEWLFSPARLPQYNGACEAGIGALKWRTERRAQGGGHPGEWTWDDVEGAREEGNTQGRAHGVRCASPEEQWTQRPVLGDDTRRAFGATLAQCREVARQEAGKEASAVLTTAETRGLDRVAVRRALVAHGYLLFSRRRIPLPIPSQKVTSIP